MFGPPALKVKELEDRILKYIWSKEWNAFNHLSNMNPCPCGECRHIRMPFFSTDRSHNIPNARTSSCMHNSCRKKNNKQQKLKVKFLPFTFSFQSDVLTWVPWSVMVKRRFLYPRERDGLLQLHALPTRRRHPPCSSDHEAPRCSPFHSVWFTSCAGCAPAAHWIHVHVVRKSRRFAFSPL
jgi:hypothetical protein